jgi:hypothetical protein
MLRQGPITQSSPNLIAQGLARPSKPIFRSSRFIRILVAVFIASYPFFIPPYFIPQYGRLKSPRACTIIGPELIEAAQSVGLTAAQGALYNTLFNVSSAIGRIGFGVIADNMTGVSSPATPPSSSTGPRVVQSHCRLAPHQAH